MTEWRRCKLHPEVNPNRMWGCPDCLFELRREVIRLRGAHRRVMENALGCENCYEDAQALSLAEKGAKEAESLEAEQQRIEALGQALGNVLKKAGVITGDQPLTGPQLLMAAESYCSASTEKERS